MSKYLNVPNGNYKVSVQTGGTIYLDTGFDTGTVEISGNLLVKGDTTTVNTAELNIEDRIITLNSGETGAGITLDASGIEINRGSYPDAYLVFDESLHPDTNKGRFVLRDGASELISLQTNEINSNSTNLLLDAGSSTVRVSPTVDYEQKVFTYDGFGDLTGYNVANADVIPNTQAVVDYVAFNFANVFLRQIGDGTLTVSSIEIDDEENTGVDSVITFKIDGNTVSQLYADRWEFDEIRIAGSTIETISSNEDLVLKSSGTGNIRIDDTLHLNRVPSDDDASLEPAAPLDGTKIYISDEYTGKSGIFFANDQGNRDELISKNRALLFSMLF